MNDEYSVLMDRVRVLMDELTAVRKRMQELWTVKDGGYRIALRPDDESANPLEDGVLMDDIVVKNVPMFRAEQMDHKSWWVACYLNDDTMDRICWWVTARSKPLRLEWVTTELPDIATYEHQVGTVDEETQAALNLTAGELRNMLDAGEPAQVAKRPEHGIRMNATDPSTIVVKGVKFYNDRDVNGQYGENE